MIKFVCDRCGQIAETSSGYFVYYTGRGEANGCNLCKGCFEEFFNWMKNKPVEDKPNENYERAYWDGKTYIVGL